MSDKVSHLTTQVHLIKPHRPLRAQPSRHVHLPGKPGVDSSDIALRLSVLGEAQEPLTEPRGRAEPEKVTSSPEPDDDGYSLLVKALEPGDLVLGLKRHHLSPFEIPLKNLFNEHYTHAAMYVGVINGQPQVIETHPEVKLTPLREFMERYKLDVFKAHLSPEEREKVIKSAMSFLGKPYEYDMLFRDLDEDVRKVLSGQDIERLYCSKLVFMTYKKAFGEAYRAPRVELLDREFVTPQGLSHSTLNGRPLFTKVEFRFNGEPPSWFLSEEDKVSLNFRRKLSRFRKVLTAAKRLVASAGGHLLGTLQGLIP